MQPIDRRKYNWHDILNNTGRGNFHLSKKTDYDIFRSFTNSNGSNNSECPVLLCI